MYRKSLFLEYLMVFAFLVILVKTVEANATLHEELTLAEVSHGSLLIESEQGKYRQVPLQQTDVAIQITGPIARTTLLQTFKNPGNDWLEAIYAFPLPENAAVDHMDLLVGDRVIQGQIQEKQQARKTYEQARQEGRKTALVEQHRPNLFTTSVANIPPNGEVSVKLQYQQQLTWRDDQFSLRFPMAITPRYTPADALPPARRIEMQQQVVSGWSILPGEIPNAVPLKEQPDHKANIGSTSIRVKLNAGFPLASIESSYHAITQKPAEDGAIEISLKDGMTRPDRDFVLQWQPQVKHRPKAAFFVEQTGTEQYGLLMLMPPKLQQDAVQSSRETLFIIDTSGSMGGASIRQARAALAMAIERLKPQDSFNIIEFNSSTRVLFGQPRQANRANKTEALSFVSRLDAGGGTEMLPALQAALRMPQTDQSQLQQVIFITDGAVGNERQLLSFIEQELGDRRLFTVGIGSAPNSFFMKEAAHFGRGAYSFIGSPTEVQEKMQQLFSRIEQPVLTSLSLSTAGNVQLLPEKIPDLYAGEPISVAFKAAQTLDAIGQVTLSGRFGDAEWKQQLLLQGGKPQAGLSVHWGREKIRQWMRAAVKGVARDKVREEVLKLAMQHHLVSEYTSLVAVDITPSRPLEQNLDKHAIDGVLPAGSSARSSMTSQPVMMASGATNAQVYLLAGILLLLFTFSCLWLEHRSRYFIQVKQHD